MNKIELEGINIKKEENGDYLFAAEFKNELGELEKNKPIVVDKLDDFLEKMTEAVTKFHETADARHDFLDQLEEWEEYFGRKNFDKLIDFYKKLRNRRSSMEMNTLEIISD